MIQLTLFIKKTFTFWILQHLTNKVRSPKSKCQNEHYVDINANERQNRGKV